MKNLGKIILKKEDIKCSVKGGQKTRISNTTKRGEHSEITKIIIIIIIIIKYLCANKSRFRK